MKTSDFELLATLPPDYDYQIFNFGKEKLIVGIKNQQSIIFGLWEGKLVQRCLGDLKE